MRADGAQSSGWRPPRRPGSRCPRGRTRFDACHELGHLVMHADATPGSPDLERQANRFASAFLLPREPFLMECPRWLDWDHFYELKRRWKVSVAAMVKRAATLGGTCGGCGLTRNARVPVKVATPAERTLVDIARPVVAPRNQGDATWLG